MPEVNKKYLQTLYQASEVREVWEAGQNEKLINHPKFGWISPNEFRQNFDRKPCPFCGKRMVHGKARHATTSKQEALARGYQYVNSKGQKYINRAGSCYFHPNYVTLDHKLNKARCPELLFDADNLQAICWKCNQEKGDNNNFEIEHTSNFVSDLAREALERYPLL